MNSVYRHLLTKNAVVADWNLGGQLTPVHRWMFGHNQIEPANNGPMTWKPRWGAWIISKDQDDWSDCR